MCYSIAFNGNGIINIDDYNGEDDNFFDWETWNPDFWASMAYANGNPYLNKGDINLRKEFWIWYLDIINLFNKNSYINHIEFNFNQGRKQNDIIIDNRTQTFQKNTIISKIKQVINFTMIDLTKQYTDVKWGKIWINGICVKSGTTLKAFFIPENSFEEKEIKLSYVFQSGEKSSANLMNKIKQEMYEQAKNEGAWLSFKMSVNEDYRFNIYFNYDDKNTLPINKTTPAYLEMEFKYFPRSKDFTPKWLRNIVEGKVNYLN